MGKLTFRYSFLKSPKIEIYGIKKCPFKWLRKRVWNYSRSWCCSPPKKLRMEISYLYLSSNNSILNSEPLGVIVDCIVTIAMRGHRFDYWGFIALKSSKNSLLARPIWRGELLGSCILIAHTHKAIHRKQSWKWWKRKFTLKNFYLRYFVCCR